MKTKREEKQRHIPVVGQDNTTDVARFRADWLKKGFDLVNVTELCEFKLGTSGWCNDWNEPDEKIYHIQIWYRDEVIGNATPTGFYPIDDEKYVVYQTNMDDKITGADFIVLRKVPLNKELKNGKKSRNK